LYISVPFNCLLPDDAERAQGLAIAEAHDDPRPDECHEQLMNAPAWFKQIREIEFVRVPAFREHHIRRKGRFRRRPKFRHDLPYTTLMRTGSVLLAIAFCPAVPALMDIALQFLRANGTSDSNGLVPSAAGLKPRKSYRPERSVSMPE
jgi:hypothetical protein